jgi:hypothetical protein
MSRFLPLWLLAALAIATASPAADEAASPTPPQTFELLINGESFLVELDRQGKLESKEKPGASYQVALRIAPQQRLELNTIRFQYEWPAVVTDDRRKPERIARIRHELGYSMIVTDAGRPIEAKDEAVKALCDAVSASLKDSGAKEVNVSKPFDRKFAGCDSKGATVRYQDGQGMAQTCVVYLLTGPAFAATCIVQFYDKDADNVLPKIKATLDSVQGLR